MAKAKNYAGQMFVEVPRYQAMWIHETNHARVDSNVDGSKGTGQILRDSLGKNGWNRESTDGIVLGVLVTERLHEGAFVETGPELIDYVVQSRKKRLDGLIAAYETAPEASKKEAYARLTVFKTFYCDKDGEVLVPKLGECFWMVDGHQRDSMSFEAGVDRLLGRVAKRQSEDETLPSSLDDLMIIPIRAISFENESERLRKQVFENEQATTGKTAMSDRDCLTVGLELFNAGYNQQAFRQTFMAGGKGQRIHGFLTLNALHPSVKLLKRATMDRVKDDDGKLVNPPGYINFKGTKHDEFARHIARSKPETLDALNDKLRRKAAEKAQEFKEIPLLTPELIEEELIPVWNGEKAKPKKPTGMSRESMEQVATAAANPLVANIMTAVLNDRLEELRALNRHSGILTAVTGIIEKYGAKRGPDGNINDPVYGGVLDLLRRVFYCDDPNMIMDALAAAQASLPEPPADEEE